MRYECSELASFKGGCESGQLFILLNSRQRTNAPFGGRTQYEELRLKSQLPVYYAKSEYYTPIATPISVISPRYSVYVIHQKPQWSIYSFVEQYRGTNTFVSDSIERLGQQGILFDGYDILPSRLRKKEYIESSRNYYEIEAVNTICKKATPTRRLVYEYGIRETSRDYIAKRKTKSDTFVSVFFDKKSLLRVVNTPIDTGSSFRFLVYSTIGYNTISNNMLAHHRYRKKDKMLDRESAGFKRATALKNRVMYSRVSIDGHMYRTRIDKW